MQQVLLVVIVVVPSGGGANNRQIMGSQPPALCFGVRSMRQLQLKPSLPLSFRHLYPIVILITGHLGSAAAAAAEAVYQLSCSSHQKNTTTTITSVNVL